MRRKYLLGIVLLGVIIGASGLGLGAFAMTQIQTEAVNGGVDKDDDQAIAPKDMVVGILDPDDGETVSGTVSIRAMVVSSRSYNLKVLLNGSLIATYVPFVWDTSEIDNGWCNITVLAIDKPGNIARDMVLVYVDNTPDIAPGIVVGILDPDYGEIISGVVKIRALVYGAESFSISILRDGIEIATTLPYDWDTTSVSDDLYTITVIAIDLTTNDVSQDEVMVYVLNNPNPTPRARVYRGTYDEFYEVYWIDYQSKNYDSTDSFDLSTDKYVVPESGYYLLTVSATLSCSMHPRRGSIQIVSIDMDYYVLSIAYFTISTSGWHTVSTTDIAYLSEGVSLFTHITMDEFGSCLVCRGSSNTYFSITKLSD